MEMEWTFIKLFVRDMILVILRLKLRKRKLMILTRTSLKA
jgi:hypothetical protein